MHAPHPSTACRTPSTGAGPLSVPVHVRSHVPPRCARHHGSTHFRSGSATPWVVQDDSWLFEYVLAESVSTVPASSCTPVVLASGFRVARSEPCAPAPARREVSSAYTKVYESVCPVGVGVHCDALPEGSPVASGCETPPKRLGVKTRGAPLPGCSAAKKFPL